MFKHINPRAYQLSGPASDAAFEDADVASVAEAASVADAPFVADAASVADAAFAASAVGAFAASAAGASAAFAKPWLLAPQSSGNQEASSRESNAANHTPAGTYDALGFPRRPM